jgi:hypothetical protein
VRAGSVRLGRLALAGPIAFTAAWLLGGLVQGEYRLRQEDISALAALDAHHAWIMITGFVLLGAGTIALAGSGRPVRAEALVATYVHVGCWRSAQVATYVNRQQST